MADGLVLITTHGANFSKPSSRSIVASTFAWVKVFDAAAKNLPADRFFCQGLFDNNLWMEILLQEGTKTAAQDLVFGTENDEPFRRTDRGHAQG